MKLHTIGIDVGKNVFSLVALDSNGQVVLRKRCSRMQVLAFTASADVQVIGMQACDGARFLESVLRDQGHHVCLMPAQNRTARIRENGHDHLRAEAIAKAARSEYSTALDAQISLNCQDESAQSEIVQVIGTAQG